MPRAEDRDRRARAALGGAAAGTAGLVLALLALGQLLPIYWVYLLATVAVTAIIARGVGLVTDQAGIITLCQMSFAAIGGWVVSGLALVWPGAPFPLLVVAGGLAAAPVGYGIGIATARVRGVELAIVTLGFAAALDLVLRQGGFPGVGSGTPVIPSAPFGEPRAFFALAWGALLLLQGALLALRRTRLGLGWEAVRSSERFAASLGVRVGRSKAAAFGAGALLAGVAGGLLAGQYGLLTTSVFTPLTSMMQLVTAVLCGASLFGGAVLAGAFGVFVPEALRRLGIPIDVGNALLAIGAFDVLRRGRGGIANRARAWADDRRYAGARRACRIPGTGGERRDTAGPAAGGAAIPRLDVSGLTVSYGGAPVLDRVSLRIAAGEVHALIGPNGAGKSTLVDAVTGYLERAEGEVRLDGDRVDGLPVRERATRGLRRTFQHSPAIDGLTVGGLLHLAAAGGAGGRARIRAVSEYFGLPDEDVPIRLVDAGSRRVLDVAAALAAAPRLLLLDEPAAGLAERESAALAARVRGIPAAFDCAVLLIEHDMAFVQAAATRATVLDDGRVIARGDVREALADERVVAAYLGREAA